MNTRTLVEQYLNGELTPKQSADFEKQVRVDSALAEELSLQQGMQNYLLNKDKKEAFKDKLQEISNDFFEEEQTEGEVEIKTKSTNNYRWLAIAVATAAAVILTIYLLLPAPNLYQQFAQHQEIQLTQKGSANDRLLSSIEIHFNQKEYGKVLSITNQLSSPQSNSLEIQIIKSICLIETNKVGEAQEILEQIANGTSAFKTEAQWHLAMSYLKTEQFEEAKKNLNRIDSNDDYWYNKAKEVLKALK